MTDPQPPQTFEEFLENDPSIPRIDSDLVEPLLKWGQKVFAAGVASQQAEIERLTEQFEIAARETTMALDGLESTWNYAGYNGYGKGVSGWDGPSLLKRFLAERAALAKLEGNHG